MDKGICVISATNGCPKIFMLIKTEIKQVTVVLSRNYSYLTVLKNDGSRRQWRRKRR
jgi:uncharacterized protein with von Willebrand factor type A (vWA) domain